MLMNVYGMRSWDDIQRNVGIADKLLKRSIRAKTPERRELYQAAFRRLIRRIESARRVWRHAMDRELNNWAQSN